ncbi:ParB/RepB/Spo0J family partition protein [Cupriavidus sp. USMAA2-4]|uniref:ParB/RepB/Spo0J family partition protein n=1 Tax=Cupriavidus sp. USMAA2-4 TaxID=876364 RepID=UPI0009FE944B|nr:ParB/RepB/Spo0J family partition protein [Cupriavidus sp. USMAA2-4]
MAKTSTETDFIHRLRNRADGAGGADTPAGRMVLHTPPKGTGKSLEELLAEHPDAPTGLPSPASSATHATSQVPDSDQAREFGFRVPLSKLKQHPWNARIARSPERIREIASSMAGSRQYHPLAVTKDPAEPGTYFIFDGDTRFKAAELLNWPDIWVLEGHVDASSPLDVYVQSFRHTEDTDPIPQIDMGIRWAQLISEKLATQEQLAERLGYHQATISRMLSFSRFPERIQAFMRENKERFPYSVAGVLVSAIDSRTEEELLALCQRIVTEEISRRAIESLLKEKKQTARAPRKAAVISKPIRLGESQVGMLRTYETGAIEFKVQEAASIDEKVLAELVDLLGAAVELVSTGETNLRQALINKLTAPEKAPKK